MSPKSAAERRRQAQEPVTKFSKRGNKGKFRGFVGKFRRCQILFSGKKKRRSCNDAHHQNLSEFGAGVTFERIGCRRGADLHLAHPSSSKHNNLQEGQTQKEEV